ncbi:hypothetical protein LO762_02205 [Actinocorallia sp. API 0066]|uniref:hypothetical protein n=1 Tax=Actinocorallia sp. API 0066 TaxID=2896846 RepID=UPI001E2A0743|nr:hypothetical protein [Actinocorallia sp. API 0066]MCD0448014.1 hypothetical protein [Actinocorallia sp. API 0066]
MLRHAARALPVPVLGAAAPVVALLLWMLDRWPWMAWPAAGIAAALVGAAAARLFDEPAAAIVDTLPRALWWRTTARLGPACLLVAGWLAAASLVDLDGAGRPAFVRLQGVVTVLCAAAWTTWLRRRGRARPGSAVAAGLLLVLSSLALRNPLERFVPLYPYGPDPEPWRTAYFLWGAAGAVAAVLLVLAALPRGRRFR